MPKQIFRAVNP